jgi:hypothetical protein
VSSAAAAMLTPMVRGFMRWRLPFPWEG